MEAEAAKLRELTAASNNNSGNIGPGANMSNTGDDTLMSDEDKEAVDSRSVYVGNVRAAAPGHEDGG